MVRVAKVRCPLSCLLEGMKWQFHALCFVPLTSFFFSLVPNPKHLLRCQVPPLRLISCFSSFLQLPSLFYPLLSLDLAPWASASLGEEILGVRCGLVSLVPTGVGFLCHFLLWDQMFPTISSVARREGQLEVTRSSPFHVPTSG